MTPYGTRTRKLPPPIHVVWADLHSPATTGSRVWLELLGDENPPRIIEAVAPHRVVWSSIWAKRPDDVVVLELASTASGSETALAYTLMTPDELPDDRLTAHLNYRISKLLWEKLRYSYGQ